MTEANSIIVLGQQTLNKMNILYRKNKFQGSHPNLEKIITSSKTSTAHDQSQKQPRATVPYKIAIPFYKNSSKNNNDKKVYHSEPPVKLTAIRRRRSISENNRRNFLTIERKSLIEHRRFIEEDEEEEDEEDEEEDYEIYNCEDNTEDEPDNDSLKKLRKHNKIHERKSSPITLFSKNKNSSSSKIPQQFLYTPNPGIPAPLHDTLTKSFSVDNNSSNLLLSSSPILSPRRRRLLFNPKRNNATLVTNMLDRQS